MKWIKRYFWVPLVSVAIAFLVTRQNRVGSQGLSNQSEWEYEEPEPGELNSLEAAPARPRPRPESFNKIRGDSIHTVLGKDALRSIDRPIFVSAKESRLPMNEPVIGVSSRDDARAYSIYLLDSHEIVNDTIGGKPVAVTW